MRYSGELAALGTAACFGGASNLFAAAGRRMGSHVLNRLRIPTAWIFLSLALWTIHHAWWPVWATPTALVALAISGMVGFVFGDAWGFRAIVILGPVSNNYNGPQPMPQVPPVTNVTISDCDFGTTVSTEQPYFLYNVRGLKLNRVKIGGKEYNTTLSA